MDIENELDWMRNFQRATSMNSEEFEAFISQQRKLIQKHAVMYHERAAIPEHWICGDCGSITPDWIDSEGRKMIGCKFCETVDRSKLPRMAFGVLLDSPEAEARLARSIESGSSP